MKTGALKPDISYAKVLVEAGLGGAASAWKGSDDQPVRQAFTGAIWAPAALGAGFGVLGVCIKRNWRRSAASMAVGGLAGTALGLGAGVVWASRVFAGSVARGALRNVNAVRDAHWLEEHPVAYG
jgi:hypothetical protein